jgi:rhamnosyltransferase
MVRYRQHSVNEFGANSDLKSYKKRVILIWSKWYKNEVNKIKSILDSNNSLNLTFRIKNFLELRRRPRDTIILLLLSILGLY